MPHTRPSQWTGAWARSQAISSWGSRPQKSPATRSMSSRVGWVASRGIGGLLQSEGGGQAAPGGDGDREVEAGVGGERQGQVEVLGPEGEGVLEDGPEPVVG